MGMFKTAVRAAQPDPPELGAMATSINTTLGPLKQPHMFVTAALLRRRSAGEFEYLLAGHPKLLHVTPEGAATWFGESQVAVGLVPDVTYRSSTLSVNRGDLIVVVTDGLMEVFDNRDRELGPDGLARAIAAVPAGAPLAAFEAAIFDAAKRHGPQLDDRTLLLVRV
jgi:serine phosphatase RsbU (regulator of sigma subunit)